MTIGIIGAGAWGTALAQVLSQGQDRLLLWSYEEDVAESIAKRHENRRYLPGQKLNEAIEATTALADMAACEILLLVTPAQNLRETLGMLPDSGAQLLLCCKGIEADSALLMSEVARQVRPDNPLAVLSGPTFAEEVAAGLPTALTLACETREQWEFLHPLVAKSSFRPYYSDDIVGAEIGGAVKNVLAIGCGVVAGAGLGNNARASLISRGFAEMQRYGVARGAQSETLNGLSGLGDLVLTCTSTQSRNFSLGKGLGSGQPAATLLADRDTVAEGAHTAPVLRDDARDRGIEMPICDAVCTLLSGQKSASEVVAGLMGRPLRQEKPFIS